MPNPGKSIKMWKKYRKIIQKSRKITQNIGKKSSKSCQNIYNVENVVTSRKPYNKGYKI